MSRDVAQRAFRAALPIMGGYVVLGLPCGLLCQQAGLDWVQVLLMCALFYSGAGQYMIPNMWLAGNPVLPIVLSVTLVNTRQTLYSAALAGHCRNVSRPLSFLFAATVTDESFGVNLARFEAGGWTCEHATLVNLFSQSSWTCACVLGCLAGTVLSIPSALAPFAMTSIFICLLCMQKASAPAVAAMLCAAAGVVACKCAGMPGPAIFIGALAGLACGVAVQRASGKRAGGQGGNGQGCGEGLAAANGGGRNGQGDGKDLAAANEDGQAEQGDKENADGARSPDGGTR
jgi:4-azaleucine resistance transporter AzlC